MSKIAVVYWSGTGNTEAMAAAVAEGAQAAGAGAELFTAAEFSPEQLQGFGAVAFSVPPVRRLLPQLAAILPLLPPV